MSSRLRRRILTSSEFSQMQMLANNHCLQAKRLI
jgi:hypothetical protein